MQSYTGWQYLLIDAANQMGLDKLTFEERIQWAETHLDRLETLADQVGKHRPLYLKAVQAIRKAQRGEATGHLVGLDAVCSGMQLMSVLTGCEAGARATGLIDPNARMDAYTEVTAAMNRLQGGSGNVSRQAIKDAVMPMLYGSKARPKELFGEGTEALATFYAATYEVAPGAMELLQALHESWQPYALEHRWVLPDGFEARIKVMQKVQTRIEVDELDHASFTYEYYENVGSEKGLSNVANVVHSVDAYVLRTMVRRCSYDPAQLKWAWALLQATQALQLSLEEVDERLEPYLVRYAATGLVDLAIVPHLTAASVQTLPAAYRDRLLVLIERVLSYPSFELVTIHDQFSCHANHCNRVRYWYKEILAELAESTVLDDILSQIYGRQGTYPKRSHNLAALIRNSNYGLS